MSANSYQEICCDVLVVGTEGTGARAALEAASSGADVLAVTKGFMARSGATLTADGEIDIDSNSAREIFGVNGSSEDSPEQFSQDMIVEGDYLVDQRLAGIHAEEAPERVKELVDWGGQLEGFIHGPGHTYPRGLWIPGLKIARLLARKVTRSGVTVLENTLVVDLLHDSEGILGALALHLSTGEVFVIRSNAVILATGGAMRMFPLTTAPDELTGDGMAMALRCGARLQDMEFPMFLPYCFITPPALRGVIFSYDVSAMVEAHALNRHGERYMIRWDPDRMERTTRDINSVAAAMEIRAGRHSPAGGTYLSFKHLPRNLIDFTAEWFPGNLRNWKAAGFKLQDFFSNIGEEAWEVAPASHFWNGGVRINEECATNIPGLYAAGEGTAGIHGANRLSGNALTMTQVWGKRAGQYAAQFAKFRTMREVSRDQIDSVMRKLDKLKTINSGPTVVEFRNEIRRISGDLVGIVREESALKEALAAITDLRGELDRQHVTGSEPCFNRQWVDGLQNENTLDVLEAVVRASLTREESRGAMFRIDFPDTDDDRWLCNLLLTRTQSGWEIQESPIEEVYFTLPKGRRPYGKKGISSESHG
jgi:succinate dehydrogenase/fumarate reductase flavoprotein subunit